MYAIRSYYVPTIGIAPVTCPLAGAVIPRALRDSATAGSDYLVQHAGQVVAATRDGMIRVAYPFGVITSYSIHYTKLYEDTRPPCERF